VADGEAPRRCQRCDAELTGRRRKWCSDTCRSVGGAHLYRLRVGRMAGALETGRDRANDLRQRCEGTRTVLDRDGTPEVFLSLIRDLEQELENLAVLLEVGRQ
jgi:uncharacterized C2H2 Zn-finger protein